MTNAPGTILRKASSFAFRLRRRSAYLRYKSKRLPHNWPDDSEAHSLPGKLYVSLTSFPPRFSTLHGTLKSIRAQTIRPDKVILWLAEDDLGQLPHNLLLTTDWLEIRPVEDIRSYKKLIPTLKAFPDAFIVTGDDDIIYRRDWLADLVRSWRGRQELICHRSHRAVVDRGKLLPYSCWEFESNDPSLSARNVATSGAGVLFPPGCFLDEVLNSDVFCKLAPTSDDLWWWWMSAGNGVMTRNVSPAKRIIVMPSGDLAPLSVTNNNSGGNDAATKYLVQKYGCPIHPDVAGSTEGHDGVRKERRGE